MRTTLTRLLAASVAVIVAGGGLAACSSAPSKPSAPTSIVTAWATDVSTLDPGWASSEQDRELSMNVYQRLLEYSFTKDSDGSYVWKGLDADPSLAESYEVEGDSAIFHLRTDVKFYPSGNPLTAEDVRWSYERSMKLGGGSDLSNGGLQKPSQIVVVDDHTVRFDFTDVKGNPVPATPTLLATMRMPNYGIVDAVTAKKHVTSDDPYASKWLRDNVVGTGPYYIAKRSPGQEIDLKAVPDSWSKAPAFKGVTIRIVQTGSVAALMRGGSVNVAHLGLSPKDVQDLKNAGMAVTHAATPDFVFLQLPQDSGAFVDQRVRQAAAYALPYDDLVKSVFLGQAQRSLSYVNLKAPGYTEAWGRYETDLAKAKELMSQAGNPTPSVSFRYSNASPVWEQVALLVKESLGKIGIRVTLVPTTPADLIDTILTRGAAAKGAELSPPDMIMYNMAIFVDDAKSPVAFFTHTQGVLNYARVSSAKMDALADANQFAAQSAERDAAYKEIQEFAADDASFLPLVVTGRSVVTTKDITGASYSPENMLRFWLLQPTT